MKKIYFLQFLIIPYLAFSQTKIYLDDNISIIINKEFTKQKMSIDEVNKFIKNEKLEKILIKEKKNLENQLSYNITNRSWCYILKTRGFLVAVQCKCRIILLYE